MVQIVRNFLDHELYQNCISSAIKTYTAGEHVFCSNASWPHDIVKDSFPVLCHMIYNDSQLYRDLTDQLKQYGYQPCTASSIMFYYWTTFSYIPWHDDAEHQDCAITVYLNEHWNKDHGGYFLYEDEKDIKAIIPEPNLAVINDSSSNHSTTPVHPDGKLRITLQMFVNRISPNLRTASSS